MRKKSRTSRSLNLAVFYILLCAFSLSSSLCNCATPALAQTEYDANLQQAAEQESQYKAQLDQERSLAEPLKNTYSKQLKQLTLSGGIAKHGRDLKIKKKISSLQYWLQKENQREEEEDAALKNLDGWTKYWQSKKDSVLRTQAWNAEQIEIDSRVAQQKALEEQLSASREAQLSQNSNYNGYGGYGGYGGHYHGYSGGHFSVAGGHVHSGGHGHR